MISLILLIGIAMPSVQGQDIRNKTRYKVVINHEEQFAVIPVAKSAPEGWKDTKVEGNLADCQAYIEEVWTDMRPLSVQKMNLPDNTKYRVVINHEEQFIIWPVKIKMPVGWKDAKFSGELGKCHDYIEEVWTDMRPLSIRKQGK